MAGASDYVAAVTDRGAAHHRRAAAGPWRPGTESLAHEFIIVVMA
jgi:hypothetical protein